MFIYILKVRKMAKIRNRYNQAPHPTQDTTWESDKKTIKHYNEVSRGLDVLKICMQIWKTKYKTEEEKEE